MIHLFITLFFITVGVIVLYSWIHELMHYAVARLLGYDAYVIRKPGLLTFLTSVDIIWKDRNFVMILLVPLVLAPLVYITIVLVSGIVFPGYYYVETVCKDGVVDYRVYYIYSVAVGSGLGGMIGYVVASFGDILYAVASLTGSEKMYRITTKIIGKMSFFKKWYGVVKQGKYDIVLIDFGRKYEKLYERYKDKIVSGEYRIVRLGEING